MTKIYNTNMLELIDMVSEDIKDNDKELAKEIVYNILRVISNVNLKELQEMIDIAYSE